MFYEKGILKISKNLQENTCVGISDLVNEDANLGLQKDTVTQVFFCEFCDILKNTFFIEYIQWVLLKIDWCLTHQTPKLPLTGFHMKATLAFNELNTILPILLTHTHNIRTAKKCNWISLFFTLFGVHHLFRTRPAEVFL